MERRIAFFDSGLGGLTVLHEARNLLPREDYLYYADTLHVPYGEKPVEAVRGYILACIDEIMTEPVKALVVACNTATSLAIAEMRRRYSIPIIGMEPAVKPAVEAVRPAGRRVLVFATRITLSQDKFANLITKLQGDEIVDALPLPELVAYCERQNFDEAELTAYFREKLAGYDLADYGAVVLGCTHYPFYRGILSRMLPPHIRLMDGNQGTVQRLKLVLQEQGLLNGKGTGQVQYRCSDGNPSYIRRMEQALDRLQS